MLALALAPLAASAQTRITTPQAEFGFNIGDDYRLANYTQLTAYWQKLARESNRMKLVDIGKTAEGRTQWMAIVSSPANLKDIEKYRQIARRLATAEIPEEQARELAADGKAIIWIDGGLHATEVLGAQQLIELTYQMVSRTDRETLRFLDDVILLGVPANPDGMELVANWYMRESDPQKRSIGGVPRLYQKYIGHDNNRDSYMSTQPETTNMGRILYTEWIPQIRYNHHQSGPAGAVLFAPPFREPYSYRFDPLMLTGLDAAGAAMHDRFAVEGKPGATERTGAPYSNWFNGGLRSTACYHNILGLITETIGNPTPIEIPFFPQRQLMTYDNPNPIAPQKWHFRQSIEYSITADRAVLDFASRNREHLLFNIYRMGRNSIERGGRDNWTVLPKRVEAAKSFEDFRKGADRDPRAYILSASQRDFPTAIKFVHALQKAGIVVQRAAQSFQANGKSYPAGSIVIKTAQAFRPHVLDMFEPQDYPNNFQYPGGPPIPPYDNAGWTLAYQMGIDFDRILDPFDGPFERAEDPIAIPAGAVEQTSSGWELALDTNDAYRAINEIGGAASAAGGKAYIPAASRSVVERLARETGVNFKAASQIPGSARPIRQPRIALVDVYGGSMPSGWTRWLFEQYKFNFEVVYPQALDSAALESKYDVILLPSGVYSGRAPNQPGAEAIPEEFRPWLGSISPARTLPRLRRFIENGGVVIALGPSARIGGDLGLPITNHMVERLPSGEERPLAREKYYIPGSVLRASVNTKSVATRGIPAAVDIFFEESPVFRLPPDAANQGITPLAWFSDAAPLRSGWGWGQHYLRGGVIAAEARIGKGRLFLFGPEMTFRAQPHGTFKFVFNAIYSAALD